MSQNKYEMEGTVTEIFPTQTYGSKGFQKREFRIKEKSDNSFPNIVPFVLLKDRCALADSLTEGAEVNVHFNLSGRMWDKGDGSATRCFCDNQVWKIDILKKGKPNVPKPAEPNGDLPDSGMDDMDVPF
jgi:hypothetical protein